MMVPRPETTVGSELRLRHTGQMGTGGWTKVSAILAALNAELTVGARGPEPFGGRRQLGKRLHEYPGPRLAMICGRSMVVRMPGVAAQTIGTAFTARLAV